MEASFFLLFTRSPTLITLYQSAVLVAQRATKDARERVPYNQV